MIPKLLHIIWLGNPLPAAVSSLVEAAERLNPDFQVRLWRDQDIEDLGFSDILVREPSMAGRADIARYHILFKHGGVYIDADFQLHKPLAGMLSHACQTGFLAARQSPGVFNNAFIGASAGHPVLAALLSELSVTSEEFRDVRSVPARTGPHYFTEKILDFTASGGRITEVPQNWVFPFFYDRPELANLPAPSATYLRHEWATVGEKWRVSAATRVTLGQRSSAAVRKWKGVVTPSRLRAWLSTLPWAHRLRDSAYRAKVSISALTKRDDIALGAAHPPEASGYWSAPLWHDVQRRVAHAIRGSATYVDVGISDPSPWLEALHRIDRPGRAVRISHITCLPVSRLCQSGGQVIRGSACELLSDTAKCEQGSTVVNTGTPLFVNNLDSGRPLIGWTRYDCTWHTTDVISGLQ